MQTGIEISRSTLEGDVLGGDSTPASTHYSTRRQAPPRCTRVSTCTGCTRTHARTHTHTRRQVFLQLINFQFVDMIRKCRATLSHTLVVTGVTCTHTQTTCQHPRVPDSPCDPPSPCFSYFQTLIGS